MRGAVPISVEQEGRRFTRWDALALLLTLGLLVFVAEASRHLLQPLSELQQTPVSLDPANLPEYAARTTLRMLVALALSLVFTFSYATFAAKSRRAEVLLVPLLDILQSVPILGFISVTVVFFMSLAPGRVLGAEFAAIFAIFTSQAWNMAFSFYQSLRTVPVELVEASRAFRLRPSASSLSAPRSGPGEYATSTRGARIRVVATARTMPRSSRSRSASRRSAPPPGRSTTRTDSPPARRSRIARSAALAEGAVNAPRSVIRYRTAPAAGSRAGSALFKTSPVEAKNRSATRVAVARSSGGQTGSESRTSRISRVTAGAGAGVSSTMTPVITRSPNGTRTRTPGSGTGRSAGTAYVKLRRSGSGRATATRRGVPLKSGPAARSRARRRRRARARGAAGTNPTGSAASRLRRRPE